MLKIRMSRPSEASEIIQIWKNSVDATHDFLTAHDRQEIEKEVVGFFLKPPCGLPPIGKTIRWDLCFYTMVIWRRFLSMQQLADVASASS